MLLAVLAGVACRRDGPAPSGAAAVPRAVATDVAAADGTAVDPDAAASSGDVPPSATGPDAAPAPPQPITSLEEYRRQALPVVCARELRCGNLGASELAGCQADDGASHPDRVLGLWEELGIGEVIESGGLAWDPEGTAACLAFWAAAPCRFDPSSMPDGCHAYWPPLRPATAPGEPCTRWDQCAGGFCPSQPGCRARCVAYVATGAACGTDTLCGAGDFCLEGTCVPRRDVGAECPGHWQACRDGLWCEGFVPENDDREWWHPAIPGKCAPPLGAGASCATGGSTDHCEAVLFCDWGQREPTCRERLAEGEECRWLDACGDGLACRGLRLGGRHPAGQRYDVRSAGTCLPFLDAGDPCDPEADVTGCPGSMGCDAATRTCRSTGNEGDPCESSWVPEGTPDDRPIRRRGCRGGLYCDVETRVCRRQLAAGERCEPRRENEDETCFLSSCDERTRRCRARCGER
jgi:hypothetical protein